MKRFLALLCFISVFSCTNPTLQTINENVTRDTDLPKDSIRYELFAVEKGYGFNILKNDRVYIRQPIIPTWAGLQPFPSKESAEAIASLVTGRLQRQDYRFLLDKADVDSLIKKYSDLECDNIGSNSNNTIRLFPISNQNDFEATSLFCRLPVLLEMPLKKRWILKDIVPFGNRSGTLSFSLDSRVFIGGGESEDQTANDFWCYNSINQTWTCLANFIGGRRMGGISFSLKGHGYWGLGQRKGIGFRSYLKDIYEYNPDVNQWYKKNNFSGSSRIDATAFFINDKAYVGLGFDGEYKMDFYEYNPLKDYWRRISDFAGGPISASLGISTGVKGFVLAGDNQTQNQKFLFEYVPGKEKWERRNDLPGGARYYLSGNNIDTTLFIAGSGVGSAGKITYRDFYLFNSTENLWTRIPDYLVPVTGNMKAASGSINGSVFIGTGHNEASLNKWNVFEYYFSVRKDIGDYNETVCYRLQYKGDWELYQECNKENCFAGIAIRTNEHLGDLCYSSRYVQGLRTVLLNRYDDQLKNILLFPRNFSIKTAIQPGKEVSLRLFFNRDELETTLQEFKLKTGTNYSINNIKLLQVNEKNPDTDPSNNSFQKGSYTFITPQWYRYGVNADIVVAEFSVSSIHSEFYLLLPGK